MSSGTLQYKILLAFIITLSLVGVITYHHFNFLPVNSLIEGLLFIFFIFSIEPNQKRYPLKISLAAILYTFMSFIFAQRGHSLSIGFLYDFTLIFKSIIYLALYNFFLRNKIFNLTNINKLLNILIFFFLTKYILSRVTGFSRPGLFVENNFELILLAALSYLYFILNNNQIDKTKLMLLSIIFLLSGSKSGVFIWALVAMTMISVSSGKKLMSLRNVLLLAILSCGVLIVFISRFKTDHINSVEDIDRFLFFQCFLEDTKNWSFWNYLIGAPRITPVTEYTTKALSFWVDLFSKEDNRKAYSVIYHSYILRTIYDHGIIILFLVFYYTYKLLTFKGYSNFNALVFISIFLLSGFSVSSLNSAFTALSLYVILSIDLSSIQKIQKKTLSTQVSRLKTN